MSAVVLEPAVKQLAMLRSGAISIAELAEEHIRQIERLNPVLNAFVDFDAERVRTRAKELEGWTGARGKLHGLPVSVKSSIATAGYRCEIGSVLCKGDVPCEDSEVVRRLRREGALILGTTNCPEFLMAYETANLLHGRTLNPWDLERTPGGSSGGEAAAIAAGMSAAGLGSDSGGSVRQPAHCTGIASLKPTPGRVPGHGHLPPCVGPFSTLGAIGPMARTIADVELMFRTVGGQDTAEAGSAPVALREITLEELRAQRIAVFEDDGVAPVTAETRAAVRSAARALREAGLMVEAFKPAELELLRKLWWTLFVQCGAMFYEPTIRGRRGQLSPIFAEFLEITESRPALTAAEMLDAWAELDVLSSRVLRVMEEWPVLLCPVASIPAWRHGEREWMVEGKPLAYLDAVRHTQWFNVLAAPAAVVPVGRSAEGLPIGVQVAGRPYCDEIVLGIAAVLDREFGYRPPPIAQGRRGTEMY
ncbi:amidase [Acidicapsa dinghuensis]|uniref:Amidase n=1 Tax=Acidicapsa dinghuensis TaxID=2218256 RepID=A0ABW1EJG9_9BACT|nr:amidase [Acidicapsa dinghuensis]